MSDVNYDTSKLYNILNKQINNIGYPYPIYLLDCIIQWLIYLSFVDVWYFTADKYVKQTHCVTKIMKKQVDSTSINKQTNC